MTAQRLLWEVQDWVKEAIRQDIRSFWPNAVEHGTSGSLEDVFSALLSLVNDGRLKIRFEMRCDRPEHNEPPVICADFAFYKKEGENVIPLSPPVFVLCTACGEKVEAKPSNLYPIFDVTEPYWEHIRLSNDRVSTQKRLKLANQQQGSL